jgi:hypothetical protein
MKIEKLAALAEIVSSVAIVATLAYLAIQTQQNTAAVQASVRQSMLEADRDSLYMAVDHPFMYRRSDLTAEEQLQLIGYLTAFIRTRENYWLQFRNGVLDESTWESYRGALVIVIFSSDFGRRVWAQQTANGLVFDPGFVAAIETWVAGLDIEDRDPIYDPIYKE